MLYANNFIPLITKPIRITDRSKTLIDHIYTNMPTEQFFPGIALTDISYHLPIFCVNNAAYQKVTDKRFYRDYQQFDKKVYLHELMQTDWNTKLNNLINNINQTTNDFIKTIEEISNKHAPIKEV